MGNAKGVNTPMTSGLKLSAFDGDPVKDVQLYRTLLMHYSTLQSPNLRSPMM